MRSRDPRGGPSCCRPAAQVKERHIRSLESPAPPGHHKGLPERGPPICHNPRAHQAYSTPQGNTQHLTLLGQHEPGEAEPRRRGRERPRATRKLPPSPTGTGTLPAAGGREPRAPREQAVTPPPGAAILWRLRKRKAGPRAVRSARPGLRGKNGPGRPRRPPKPAAAVARQAQPAFLRHSRPIHIQRRESDGAAVQ